MDGFSFPPPPPPPPKAASSSQPEAPNQSNNRGGRGGGRGRGGRGSFRGRGGASNRSGGNFQPQNTNNSGYGQNTGNYQSSYGSQQQQYPQQYQNNQQYPTSQQYQSPQQYQPPPGSYVNPAFGGMQAQAYHQSQNSQYGQPNGLATGNNQPSYGHQSHANSPPVKRTRDQAFGNSNRGHPMKKPSSGPKAQVAPSVPSFGAPILPAKPPVPLSSEGGLKQRPPPSLGLIPSTHDPLPDSDAEDDDDEEEEVDEEAALSALQNGPLSFEFNGELSTLGSASDIAEWIEERKKRWPSKRRVEEKEQEVQSRMQERRRIEQETRAAIAVASGGEYQPVERRDARPARDSTAGRLARGDEDSTIEDTAEREHPQESTTSATQRPNQAAEGPAATEPRNDQHHSDSDSDAPPEVTSSKPSQPLRIPPPPTTSNTHAKSAPSEGKYCISFVNQGRCKFGNKCRYKHDTTHGQERGKRKTLFQRLVEQEMDEENKLALQAIKYLGGVGFFSKHAGAA